MAADSGSHFLFAQIIFLLVIPAALMQFLVRHRLIVAFAVLSFAVLLFLWCSKKQQRVEKKPEKVSAPATSPMADTIRFQYAVYYLPDSSSDAPAIFRKVLTKEYPALKSVDKIPERTEETIVST